MDSAEFKLHRETEAAKLIISALTDPSLQEEFDSALARDTIEGETNLHETIELVAKSIVLEDEVIIDGIGEAIKNLQRRKADAESRIERKRTLIQTAMQIAELDTIKTAVATISMKAVPAKLLITEESLIPTQYFVRPDPVIDKKALNETGKLRIKALADANKIKDETERQTALEKVDLEFPAIPGTEISNGSQTIQLRK